jgi:hypothetical protein
VNTHRYIRTARSGWVLALLPLVMVAGGLLTPAHAASPIRGGIATGAWRVNRKGTILQISYGSGRSFPQYAALDLRSGYFRMVYSTASRFGASIVLLPALWSKASCPTDYCQGAPVTATWRRSGASLKLSIRGTIATLKVTSSVTISPPAKNALVARVSTQVAGTVKLDKRPGEAFKPVMLSSMHISSAQWDSRAAFTGTRIHFFPSSGWIVHPPLVARDFGLQGGTSAWKKKAPTYAVALNAARQITGWVTWSKDPNDDNVAFWCAANKVLRSWRFSVTAEAGKNR